MVEEKGALLMTLEEMKYYLKDERQGQIALKGQWAPIKSEPEIKDYVSIGDEAGLGKTHSSLKGQVPDQSTIKADESFSALCYTFKDCEPFGVVNRRGICELCDPEIENGDKIYRFPDRTRTNC